MNILALDTSSVVATAALLDETKLIGEKIINHKKTHSQKLLPMIAELLESCQMDMEQIDIIAVAEGPGSFTGLRIGIATAKGLAHAMDIPVIGISTLEALAFNLPFCQGLICPILDARRNQVYTGVYQWIGERLNTVLLPIAVTVEELIDKLSERSEEIVFVGDGVAQNKELLQKSLKEQAKISPLSVKMPRASAVAELALQKAKNGDMQSFYDLMPVYLRKSEAERQYDVRLKQCESEDHEGCQGSQDG